MPKLLQYITFLIVLTPPAMASLPGIPDSGVLKFAILRNGTQIGRHIFRFEHDASPTIVRIDVKIDYRLAFIPVYMFRHHAREVWRDGRLVGMTADTNDNGDVSHVAVKPDGEALSLSVNGDTTPLDAGILPASLWHNAQPLKGSVLDPADGDLMKVSIRKAGEESIVVRGHTIRARHYTITGDFQRDLWYDRHGVLVQVRFKAEDGSEIRYVLQ